MHFKLKLCTLSIRVLKTVNQGLIDMDMDKVQKDQKVPEEREEVTPDSKPIEPQRLVLSKLSILKLTIFLLFIGYALRDA